ncbi:15167_t:CDS:2 [Entrophospora sp. SA101]|nr:15167_t:CDS:2 [Entrophospora sp. SA101]
MKISPRSINEIFNIKPLPETPQPVNILQSPTSQYVPNTLLPLQTNQGQQPYINSQYPPFSTIQQPQYQPPFSTIQQPPYSQPFSPIQQTPYSQPFSSIQQTPYSQPFPPIQQTYNPHIFNPPIDDISLEVEPLDLQIPIPGYEPNPPINAENADGLKRVLSQYVTKVPQEFEDYGIDVILEESSQPPPEDAFCHNCKSKKVDTDLDGFPGEYCSDECRKAAVSESAICTQCNESPQVSNSQFCGWKSCRNPYYKETETNPSSLWSPTNYIDQTPNQQSLINPRSDQICINCKGENALVGSDFCSDGCEVIIKTMVPCLLRLSSDGQKYKDITNQFIAAWKHPGKTPPEVADIWKIFCSENLNTRYNMYRNEVENQRKFAGKFFGKGEGKRKMSAGNEQRRFHGTKTSCYIGLTSGDVCNGPTCSVCCIIREGYKLRYANTTYQRFGRGIYFSGTSSKSDDYNEGSLKYSQGSKYKVMILNKVVVGQGYQLTKNSMNLTEPPAGFDSILGEPSDTGNLNYDEIVVYREESSIPQYLIVYKV